MNLFTSSLSALTYEEVLVSGMDKGFMCPIKIPIFAPVDFKSATKLSVTDFSPEMKGRKTYHILISCKFSLWINLLDGKITANFEISTGAEIGWLEINNDIVNVFKSGRFIIYLKAWLQSALDDWYWIILDPPTVILSGAYIQTSMKISKWKKNNQNLYHKSSRHSDKVRVEREVPLLHHFLMKDWFISLREEEECEVTKVRLTKGRGV